MSDYYNLEFNLDEDRAQYPDDFITAPQPEPPVRQRYVWMDEALDERIAPFVAEGICPMCQNDLDTERVCPVCSFNANAPRRTAWSPEQEDDYIPVQPLSLFDEEYAPAQLNDEAA